MKKLKLLLMSEKKIDGFSLIELTISIFLISTLLLSVISLFLNSNKVFEEIENNYEGSFNVYHSIDYIINEIDMADCVYIKNIDEISSSSQIGLILENKVGKEFSYTTFILEDAQILRLNLKNNLKLNDLTYNLSYINFKTFGGLNTIISSINKFEKEFIESEGSYSINIKISSENFEAERFHNIRGVVIE